MLDYTQRLQTVNTVRDTITPPDDTLQALCHAATHVTDADSAFVNLITDRHQILIAHAGQPIPGVHLNQEIPLSLSICQFVVQRAGLFIVDDAATQPELASCGAVGAIGSYVGAPIRINNQAVGAFGLSRPTPAPWATDDCDYAVMNANLVARSLHGRVRH